MQNKTTIIIADCHVSIANNNQKIFFDFLQKISQSSHDIIFLGDIFDLWINFPRFENKIHHQFLQWCKKQKEKRTVGFIEGNHEFFLHQQHADCFTWSAETQYYCPTLKTLFLHGDLINSQDTNYKIFRKLSKNPIAKQLIHIMPFAPLLAQKLKIKLKQSNRKHKKYLPKNEIKKFANKTLTPKIETIICGHFHQQYQYKQKLQILPDWYSSHKILLINNKTLSKQIKKLNSI